MSNDNEVVQRNGSLGCGSIARILFACASLFPLIAHSQAPSASDTSVSLGIVVEAATACGADKGLCINGVRANSIADRAGVKSGDVLQRVGTIEVNDMYQLIEILRTGKAGQPISMSVRRNGAVMALSADVGASDMQVAAKPVVRGAVATPPLAFELVQPKDFDALLASVANKDTSITLSNDVLSIVHRDVGDAVVIGGSLQMPMTRIENSNVWYLQLKRKDWERMFFSYRFAPTRAARLEETPMQEYRGPLAPQLHRVAVLKGRIVTRTIRSKYLNDDRPVSIYLPPNARSKLPVLFMADGSFTETFARVIEPLITRGTIKPIAIVGIHESQAPINARGIDRRTEEYVSLVAPEIAAAHMQFFIEEVMPSMTNEFNLSNRREDRAIFGFSNGAAFASTVGSRHPSVFAHVLPFSLNLPRTEVAKKDAPIYYFAAGELEPYFLSATRNAHEQAIASGAASSNRVYMSGHDLLMWQLALSERLPDIFSVR